MGSRKENTKCVNCEQSIPKKSRIQLVATMTHLPLSLLAEFEFRMYLGHGNVTNPWVIKREEFKSFGGILGNTYLQKGRKRKRER